MVTSMPVFTMLFLLSTSFPVGALAESDCTLNPTEGTRRMKIDENIVARITWSSCHSMVKRIDFEWPAEIGFPDTPNVALSRAARLVSKWQEQTKESISPFAGSVVTALEDRATHDPPYRFRENIPVSDDELDVAGWDGVWIELSSTTKVVQLTVHYWANP
jgi:hypothetical protein